MYDSCVHRKCYFTKLPINNPVRFSRRASFIIFSDVRHQNKSQARIKIAVNHETDVFSTFLWVILLEKSVCFPARDSSLHCAMWWLLFISRTKNMSKFPFFLHLLFYFLFFSTISVKKIATETEIDYNDHLLLVRIALNARVSDEKLKIIMKNVPIFIFNIFFSWFYFIYTTARDIWLHILINIKFVSTSSLFFMHLNVCEAGVLFHGNS